jgi:transcriptional regulator with XRE-family HTH domain
MSVGFNTGDLGAALRRERKQRGNLSLREVGAAIGVSCPTLSRIERGVGHPDARVVASLTAWLKIPVSRFLERQEDQPVVYYPSEATPEIVRAHLEKDKNLTPETAAALAELFDVAYRRFAK